MKPKKQRRYIVISKCHLYAMRPYKDEDNPRGGILFLPSSGGVTLFKSYAAARAAVLRTAKWGKNKHGGLDWTTTDNLEIVLVDTGELK